MTDQHHTPAPWMFSFQSVDPEWAVVTTPGGAVIANVNADTRQDANARLISAAPDLLAILQTLTNAMPKNGGTVRFDGDELAAARAAIAKATA